MSDKKSAIGSRAQVMHGTADHTSGGLKKTDLKYNEYGKIVSKAASAAGRKAYARNKDKMATPYGRKRTSSKRRSSKRRSSRRRSSRRRSSRRRSSRRRSGKLSRRRSSRRRSTGKRKLSRRRSSGGVISKALNMPPIFKL